MLVSKRELNCKNSINVIKNSIRNKLYQKIWSRNLCWIVCDKNDLPEKNYTFEGFKNEFKSIALKEAKKYSIDKNYLYSYFRI